MHKQLAGDDRGMPFNDALRLGDDSLPVLPVRRNARDVPVAGFGKFFLTLPATPRAGPYAEFLGLIKPTEKVNHDTVQLYR